jgi:hypothetical protein
VHRFQTCTDYGTKSVFDTLDYLSLSAYVTIQFHITTVTLSEMFRIFSKLSQSLSRNSRYSSVRVAKAIDYAGVCGFCSDTSQINKGYTIAYRFIDSGQDSFPPNERQRRMRVKKSLGKFRSV